MFRILLLLLVTLLISCSDQEAGGSIEVSNGYVAGVIYNSDSTVAAFQECKLYPADYNPGLLSLSEVLRCTTNAKGAFNVAVPVNTNYNLITRSITNEAALVPTRTVSSTDTLQTGIIRLAPTGVIKVTTSSLTTNSGYLYLEGTDIYSFVSGDIVTLLGVPTANSFSIVHKMDDTKNELVEEQVYVNDTDTVTFPALYTVLVLGHAESPLQKQLLSLTNELDCQLITREEDTIIPTDSANISAIIILPQSNLTDNEIALLNSFEKPLLVSDYTKRYGLHMSMSVTSNKEGFVISGNLYIRSDTHPIIQGIHADYDDVVVSTPYQGQLSKLGWSIPGSPAIKLAVGVQDQTNQHLFTLEKDDKMYNDFVMPEKRVAFFAESGILTEDGKRLFTRSMQWLLGNL